MSLARASPAPERPGSFLNDVGAAELNHWVTFASEAHVRNESTFCEVGPGLRGFTPFGLPYAII